LHWLQLIFRDIPQRPGISHQIPDLSRRLLSGYLTPSQVAIRAYDPCLSCATHALGQMPLEVSLVNTDGSLRDQVLRAPGGTLQRPSWAG
jgi:NAD-reducing hydrogenase large subunit